MNGILAMVGGGEFEPAMKYVDRVLLDKVIGEPRVAVLPTAAGQDPGRALAIAETGAAYFRDFGVESDAVPIIDRESAMDETLAERVEAANVIYLTDGNAHYLYQTLQFSPAWTAIGNVIEMNGIVAASGASASVFGDRIPASPMRWRPAFNIFPGAVIIPHFESASRIGLRLRRWSRFGRFTYLGVDRHTAIFSQDFRFTVVGEGGVTVWSRLRHEKRDDGDLLLWP